ncbi:DEP domain-containing protein 1B-like isoform X1 [Montipora foliosa]|uniref:DEP domain-containing protein 1B-like isoform X1 n=2 Tax=Montipora foliosa TaxID=591990 RepID=UPI0035F21A2B
MWANMESSSDTCRGPFSATKLWNEAVRQLKVNVPIKRRRWRMRMFEDVFVASEAVDWLHGFLKENPNFCADVTRQQAVQLCTKFLKNGIIADAIHGDQYDGTFEDNGHLYRFTDKTRYSPYKTLRSPRKEKPLTPKIDNRAGLAQTSYTIYEDETANELKVEKGAPSRSISAPFLGTRVYNLRSRSLSTTRSPLVNKLNVLSAAEIDSQGPNKSTGSVKRRRSSRRGDSLEEVIMNPAAFVSHSRRSLTENEIRQVWWSIATARLKRLMDLDDSFLTSLRPEGYDISCVQSGAHDQRIPKAVEVLPHWLISAMKCLIHWPNWDYTEQSFPKYPGFEQDVFKAIIQFFGEEERCPLVPRHLLQVFKKTVDFLFKCKLTAMRSLQYCCLLIPVKNRNLLKVLLKFMVRLLDNHAISLSNDLPPTEMLIQSFSWVIFGVTADMDVIRLMYLMLETFPEYFKSPEGLEFQVQQRLLFLRNCRESKITMPPEAPTVSFCERVTPQEYKEQSLITSQRSLKDLLNKIVDDETLSAKEKRKQLRQFEKSYPDIYQAKFPGDNLSTSSQASQSSERLKQVMKPLNLLRNLR